MILILHVTELKKTKAQFGFKHSSGDLSGYIFVARVYCLNT